MTDETMTTAAPAVADAQAVADTPAATTTTDTTPAPTMRDTMASVLAKYPVRGDDGKFETRFPDTADAAPADGAPATKTPDQPEAQAVETASPSIDPPASWSADVKAKWAALPPDVQTYIAQREGEAHKAITTAGERAKAYEALEAVIGPRRAALAAGYGNEAAALNELFGLSDFATQDPAGFVRWFAQQRGVDLSQIVGQPAAQPSPAADPSVAAIQQRLDGLTNHIVTQQERQLLSEIDRFASAKGDDGQPLRPHFADVRADMGKLISAGLATTLDDAYAKAVRANDAVWSKVQAEQAATQTKAAAEKAEREKAERAKAAASAKRAASVNVRTTGSVSGSPAGAQSMRATMEAVARRYAAGAA